MGSAIAKGLWIGPLWLACGGLFAQPAPNPTAPPAPPPPPKIEPGLEEAVNWKWNVAPPAKPEWGMPLQEASTNPDEAPPAAVPVAHPESYEVKKGDVLVKIAKMFDMSVAQLKQFNGLKDDRINIGQVLRIPTMSELAKMAPPPPPPEAKPAPTKSKSGKKSKEAPEITGRPGLELPPTTLEELELQTVLLQVFLDREMFSPGAIDGEIGPGFRKISQIYQQSHLDAATDDQLKSKALAYVKEPYTTYVLRPEDFKFIKPKDEPAPAHLTAPPPPKKKGAKPADVKPPAPTPPMVTWQDMSSADFLAYSSAWEFVAERYHSDEAFLKHINPRIKGAPVAGMTFQVPNVIPFEIEKTFDPPLQPEADPQQVVSAAVVELSRLEITRSGQLIAVLPLASARPGLHGRGSWTILDVVPQPRMATTHEPRETPKDANPTTPAVPPPAPDPEQFLASGPNNPVGVLWINLAKTKNGEPLPYGLHGTSIPGFMRTYQGIGGFRLSNWDIARVVRLLPAGTALQWKDKPAH